MSFKRSANCSSNKHEDVLVTVVHLDGRIVDGVLDSTPLGVQVQGRIAETYDVPEIRSPHPCGGSGAQHESSDASEVHHRE